MPETTWLLYAGSAPAPLCRKVIGSYVPEDDIVLARIAEHPVNRVDEFTPWRVADQLRAHR
jgi:hypothetical protein